MGIESELIALKEKIEVTKRRKNQTEGRLEGLMEQLSSKYNLPSVEAAEIELKKIAEEIDDLEGTIEKDLRKLEKQYA